MPQDILGLEEKRYRGIDSLILCKQCNSQSKPDVLAGFEAVAQGQSALFLNSVILEQL